MKLHFAKYSELPLEILVEVLVVVLVVVSKLSFVVVSKLK